MLDVSIEDYSGLVHLIYAAALEPGRWPEVLDRLSGLLDGSPMSLQAHDTIRNASLGEVTSTEDPEFKGLYDRHFGAINPWGPGLAVHPKGMVGFPELYFPRDALRKTEFYNDYLRRFDIISGGGIAIDRDPDRVLFLVGNIRQRSEDVVRPRVAALFRLLLPHLAQAFSVMRTSLPLQVLVATGATGRGAPTLAIDARGRLVFSNRDAEALLADGGLLRTRNGILEFVDAAANDRLAAALRQAAAGRADLAADTVIAPRAAGAPIRADFVPVGRPETATGWHTAVLLGCEPVLLVVLHAASRAALDEVAARCKLTATEAGLLRAIVAGVTPRQYADRRGVTPNTVKTQLSSIFAKTGTASQSQLVGLFVSADAP